LFARFKSCGIESARRLRFTGWSSRTCICSYRCSLVTSLSIVRCSASGVAEVRGSYMQCNDCILLLRAFLRRAEICSFSDDRTNGRSSVLLDAESDVAEIHGTCMANPRPTHRSNAAAIILFSLLSISETTRVSKGGC